MSAPISADWLEELGWHTWIQKTGADTEALWTLVTIPRMSYLKSYLPQKNTCYVLEIGILAIY